MQAVNKTKVRSIKLWHSEGSDLWWLGEGTAGRKNSYFKF